MKALKRTSKCYKRTIRTVESEIGCASQVDAGMDKELVFGDPKAPRFVWWEKKLRATPSGPDALTFDLLSIGGKLRAGFGALGIKQAAPGNPSRYAVYFLPFCLYAKATESLLVLFHSAWVTSEGMQ